ncbi:capsular biosynthesis protein [Sphingomonas psychrotolerans]|uniref:Capsular biosynthesis protein n=1 Tax=Sphingomonas psychrotolerans TaxID=1327635 RepID=A0ABU3N5J6_9SPHN|nr:capsular biosynthesis protein [Sphingomonas psychrotolerans]MDT8759808.1 capsular biosynthesis protein [Sphingomonas psychrotolerans]
MRLRSTAGANPLLAEAAFHPGGDPEAPTPAGLGLLQPGDKRVDPLVTAAFDADDPYVAKVRKVRAKLLATAREAGGADGRLRLAILSLQGGDEASILAANLAAVLAQMDGPTILVDADVDRPSLDRLLRLPNRIGLAEQLGGMALRLPVLQSAIDNLWLMPAGQAAGGAATLVEKGSLAEAAAGWNLPGANLLAFLAERPRGGTAFGNILEKFDAVVLVTRRGVTPVAEIRRVIDDLDRHQVPIAGSVVS